jgi:hypothetical protein
MSYLTPVSTKIPHYHGDIVRGLFFAMVAISFAAIPLVGHILPFGDFFEVISGIILIILAGLTNPHSRWVMVLNIIVSAVGAGLLELAAFALRTGDAVPLLLVRETGALVMIAALYFSVKTVRAMAQGKLGEAPQSWEFEKIQEAQSQDEQAAINEAEESENI